MSAPPNPDTTIEPADEPPPPPSSSPRRRRQGLRYLAAVVFTAGLAGLVLPDLLFQLDRYTPLAQLVSLRPYILLGAGALEVLLLVALRFDRRMWPVAAGALAVLIVGATMVLPRAVAEPAPTGTNASPGGRALTVVALNVFNGQADVDEVAAMIRTEQPDLVSLLEAGEGYRARLAPLVEPLGYRLHASTGDRSEDLHGVTAVVSDRLGAVQTQIGTETTFHSIQVSGGGLGALRFVAYHSLAPRRGDVPRWRADLAQLPQWCASRSPAIIAGDFNATLDHSTLREAVQGCADAAAQRGDGLVPTWPTWAPDWLGPQIDHVFATDGITADTFTVAEVAGSDHRAVITRLHLPG